MFDSYPAASVLHCPV